MITAEDLNILKKPFPDSVISVKVQSLSKDKSKAMLVQYAQHTDVQNRLEEVDPAWSCTVLDEKTVSYGQDSVVYVRMRMTVKGIARENVGDGNDPKSAYSDAIKRCAMLFGVGRYLYDSETKWVPYNEQQDKYRQFSITDFGKRPTQTVTAPAQVASVTNIKKPQAGNFVIPYGQHQGKRLSEFSTEELTKWKNNMLNKAEREKRKIEGQQLEIVQNISAYCSAE